MKTDYPEFKLNSDPPAQAPQKARASEASLSEEEHEKITNLCNIYGLNEEETRQLIDELKAGGNLSIEQPRPKSPERRQSSIVSIRNEEMSFNDSEFRFDEEYSFKQNQRRVSMSSNGGDQQLEKVLAVKFRHEDDYIEQLRQENSMLRSEKAEMASKLTTLMKMKEQETDIMLGLKNAVCSLTALLSDKESAYIQLQQDYARLVDKLESRKVVVPTNDKENWQQHQPRSSKLEKKESRENLLTEASLKDSNLERKPSKQFSKNRSTTNFHAPPSTSSSSAMPARVPPINTSQLNAGGQVYIENLRQQVPSATTQEKQDSNKQQSLNRKQKIDISKYKVFIDELRNICINKQK